MNYGYSTCGVDPCYNPGYAYPMVAGVHHGHGGFALIVVLFILLIIIGSTCFCK